MTGWEAVLLGAIEGITEFLPVSSTGHLVLAQRALGIDKSRAADAYAVVIQGGAILAVLGLYRDRVAQALRGLVGHDAAGRHLLACLAVAFLPAAVIGLLLDDPIERVLFGLWPIAAAWLVGGAVLLALARSPRLRPAPTPPGGGPAAPPDGPAAPAPDASTGLPGRPPLAIDLRTAALVGLCQTLALWPGTSRSLATILGGVLLGLPLAVAVEFSFLLGVLTLGAATGYKALHDGRVLLDAYGWVPLLVGTLAAWASAAVAVRGLVAWLQRRGLAVFGWYRVALGLTVAALLAAGKLEP